jgi:hypothetical protein
LVYLPTKGSQLEVNDLRCDVLRSLLLPFEQYEKVLGSLQKETAANDRIAKFKFASYLKRGVGGDVGYTCSKMAALTYLIG